MKKTPDFCLKPSEFKECDPGHFYKNEAGNAEFCVCYALTKKKNKIDEYLVSVPKRFDLKNHEKRDRQREIIEQVVCGDQKNFFLRNGVWLWGSSHFGKTHMIYYLIWRILEKSAFIPKYYIINTKDLLTLFEDQYNFENRANRAKARIEFENLKNSDIVFINDIDKIGNVSKSREQNFFNIIDSLYENKKILLITSQFSIQDFCTRFQIDRTETMRFKSQPFRNRLETLCQEFEV